MTETSGRLTRPDGQAIAWRRVEGRGPTVLWLGGFASDMAGSKAQALADWAAREGRSFLRFDYLGHGESSGAFRDGTIGRWREDALAVLDALTEGPVAPVGSSMGGWIACLLALARPGRIAAVALVAPAADFTEALVKPGLTAAQRAQMETEGFCALPSSYAPEGLIITRALLQDGASWSILGAPVPLGVPVRVLHGAADADVPWAHGLALFEAIQSPDASFTLVKDGDHRLSRPQDLERLARTVAEVVDLASPAWPGTAC